VSAFEGRTHLCLLPSLLFCSSTRLSCCFRLDHFGQELGTILSVAYRVNYCLAVLFVSLFSAVLFVSSNFLSHILNFPGVRVGVGRVSSHVWAEFDHEWCKEISF
jgi:hypothetical protein